jgi:VWFA-related protein
MVLDDLDDQSDLSQAATTRALRSETVRQLANEFIDRNLGDNDRAALIATSGRRDMAQEFTNNRQRLRDAANRYQGGYGAVTTTSRQSGLSFASPGGGATSDSLHSTMLSLTSLAKWLALIDGRRKSIVLFSDRLGRPLRNGVDLQLAAEESADVRDFVQAAARGNVSLYVIDPVGVPGGRGTGVKPITADIDDGSVFDADRQQSLITLAEATGGFAAVRTTDYTAALKRIVSESSSYYLVGFVSSNRRMDGKFRKIDVRVTRPNLRVNARSGYVAPKSGPDTSTATAGGLPPALSAMLKNPVAVSGLPLSIAAPVFRGSSKSKAIVAVVVETGAGRVLLTSGRGRFNGGVTLVMAAADGDGKVQAIERGALTFRLSPETRQAIQERGARVVSQLELKPGRYELKVAAIDSADGSTRGSVLYDLDVPDFSKGLTMSGVVLSSTTEPPVPTVQRDAKMKLTVGDSPTARREFTRLEQLREYIEVYDTGKGAGRPVVVSTRVMNAAGGLVFRREVTSEGVAGSDKTYTHRLTTTIPLSDLGRGRYVLAVDASRSGDPAVSRQLPFSIR